MQNPTLEELGAILKKARRIAVVGLSDDPGRTSHQIAKALQHAGYDIVPVNPMVDEVLGKKSFQSLRDIPGHVDIVNIFRRSEFLPELAREFAEMDADVFWAQQGVMHEEAYEFLRARGHSVVMDSCIKVVHALTVGKDRKPKT